MINKYVMVMMIILMLLILIMMMMIQLVHHLPSHASSSIIITSHHDGHHHDHAKRDQSVILKCFSNVLMMATAWGSSDDIGTGDMNDEVVMMGMSSLA